jgi:hypothetical protein
VRHRKELGARKNERIDYRRAGYLIPAPDAPWLECFILDVSGGGICLDVGALHVPDIFGVAFNADGKIRRVCKLAWRRDTLLGGQFLTAKQLRETEKPPCAS